MINDIEKNKLEQLNEDRILLEAIKKVMLDIPNPTGLSTELSDELLGQNLRAFLTAIGLIKRGFKELEKFKKVEQQQQNNINPAR